jgi:hypothetical protein
MDEEKMGRPAGGIDFKGHLSRWLVLLFVAAYLANYFLQWAPLTYIGSLLLILIMLQGIPRLPKVNFRVVCGLLLAGGAILLWSKANWKVWPAAIMQNANLAVLFSCTPMMSLPFFYEDYQSELKVVAQTKMRSLLTFCLLLSVSTHILGVMISAGALAIIYELLQPQSKLYQAEDVFLSTLMRSYCVVGFWAPNWSSMALLTSVTSVTWVAVIPIGIVFVLISMAMNMTTVALKMKREPRRYPLLNAEAGTRVNWRKIRTMLLLALALILLLMSVSLLTGWNLMIIIPMAAAVFPLLCGLLQRHMPAYKRGISKYYTTSLIKVRGEMALFAAAGFLGKALQISGIGERIPALLPPALAAYPALMSGAIMLLLILPSLIGVHAAAMGSALVAAITPAGLGMTDMTFVLTVLMGWTLSVMLSPFSAVSLLAGNYAGRPSWSISLKLNGLFGAVCVVVFSILISLVGPALS